MQEYLNYINPKKPYVYKEEDDEEMSSSRVRSQQTAFEKQRDDRRADTKNTDKLVLSQVQYVVDSKSIEAVRSFKVPQQV